VTILGIETSCDETAASIVVDGTKILANIVASSQDLHKKTGGIIPETAAREQVLAINPVISRCFDEANLPLGKIDAIAVTNGPGLFGSLIIGVETAKSLSYAWKKPLIPVNHLIGHIYANWLEVSEPPAFPNLCLIVSGGHSELVLMKNHGDFIWLGGSRDDAAGEAFDKTARLLELNYPGGPAIQKVSERVNKLDNFLPRPLSNSADFDFSFSGLKTAVSSFVGNKTLNQEEVSKLAAEIQEAIVDSLLAKTFKATKKFAVKTLLLAGGVAANKRLVEKAKKGFAGKVFVPEPKLCIDNGAMIAAAAYFNYSPISWEKVNADSGLFFD